MLRPLLISCLVFLVLFLAPAALRALVYWRAPPFDWRGADRSAALASALEAAAVYVSGEAPR